jgi:ABC-type phosphate transport system substrate-binding protein
MNDDFLHRIRVEPPTDFLARLKARLDRQPPPTPTGRGPLRSVFRVLAFGLLFGGSVFAITLLTITGVPDAARHLFWKEQSQPNAAAQGDGPTLSGGQRRHTQPMPFDGERQRAEGIASSASGTEHEQLNAERSRSTADGGSAGAGSPTTSPTRGTTAANSLRIAEGILTPKALEAYTALLTTSDLKVVKTTDEALAQLCSVSGKARYSSSPSIAFAARRMTRAEFDTCTRHGTSIAVALIGHQAIVLVRSRLYGALDLSPRDLFLALAARIPDPANPETFIRNPNSNWNRVNPALENEPIEVMGPSLSSTTGMAFRELLLAPGCQAYRREFSVLQHMDDARYEQICSAIRDDGVYVEIPERPYGVVDKLQSNPNAIGIVGYLLFSTNTAAFTPNPIAGVIPSTESISAGTYPGSRPLYVYAIRYPWTNSVYLRGNAQTTQTYSVIMTDAVRNDSLPISPVNPSDLKP